MSLRALTIALAAAALAPGVLARPFTASGTHSAQRGAYSKIDPESRFNNPPPPSASDDLDESKVMTLPTAEPVSPGFHSKRDLASSTENEFEDEKVVGGSDIMMRPPANVPPFKPHAEKRGEAPPGVGHIPASTSTDGDEDFYSADATMRARSNDPGPEALGERFGAPPFGGYVPPVGPGKPSKRFETPPVGGYIPHEGGDKDVDSFNVGDLPLNPTDPSLEPGLPKKRDTPTPPTGGHIPQSFEAEDTVFDGKTMMLPPADHRGPGTNH